LQPSRSFKSRGIGNFIETNLKVNGSNNETHFYISSGGNAGLAAVVAARSLNYPASVVVPTLTKPLMIARLKAAGASEVIQIGANWNEADTHLREVILAANPHGIYIPPFDHPYVWEGHSTLVGEVKRQLSGTSVASSVSNGAANGVDDGSNPTDKPDAIICSVGGGGLFSGIMQGLDKADWADVPIIVVETVGAESLNAALKAGELVTLPKMTSRAISLGAIRVAKRAFEYAQRSTVRSVVLSDAEAAMGCWRLADDERIMVELACGVNVALCYDGRLEKALGRKLTKESKVVIVLCGGSDVTVDMLTEWRKEYGYVESEIPHNDSVPSSVTAPIGAAN
jgi:L-serine/L-threonine ammonia-lyase